MIQVYNSITGYFSLNYYGENQEYYFARIVPQPAIQWCLTNNKYENVSLLEMTEMEKEFFMD